MRTGGEAAWAVSWIVGGVWAQDPEDGEQARDVNDLSMTNT